MTKIIEFKKSSISLSGEEILKDFNLSVEKNKHLSIIGTYGKTTILKALAGIANATNLKVKEHITVVFNDLNFKYRTIYKEIKNKKIINEFKIKNNYIYNLSKEDKVFLKILSALARNSQIIAIDDLFNYLNKERKKSLMEYIKRNKITIILVTSDIEDTLYTDNICVIDSKKIIIDDKINIYIKEKLLNEIGYGLPFIVELSLGLGYYDLLSEIYLTKEELVGVLWK